MAINAINPWHHGPRISAGTSTPRAAFHDRKGLRMKRFSAILAILAACLLVACSVNTNASAPNNGPAPSNTSPAHNQPDTKRTPKNIPPMPAGFEIMVGSGGGVTGEWSWRHLAADGSVHDDDSTAGKVSQNARQDIWRALHELDPASDAGRPGNMTTTIRWRTMIPDNKEGWTSISKEGHPAANSGPFGAFVAEFRRVVNESLR